MVLHWQVDADAPQAAAAAAAAADFRSRAICGDPYY
jgi:hypothetical protein